MTDQTEDNIGESASNKILGPNPLIGLDRNSILRSWQHAIEETLKKPKNLIKHQQSFAQELLDIIEGKSDRSPVKGDRRFKNDLWHSNYIYKSYMQSYLAYGDLMTDWVRDLDIKKKHKDRALFLVQALTDSSSATNTLLGNPDALKEAMETNGASVLQGMQNFVQDMIENDGMPSQVNKNVFQVGGNIATTQGVVVLRDDMFELIQYKPTTEKVSKIPLLIVPPQINKFYVFDLKPENSLFQFLLDQGIQVFTISWKNPTKEDKDWGLERYVKAVEKAGSAVMDITRSAKINVYGACSGGITTAVAAAHLASIHNEALNSLTLVVATLDMQGAEDGPIGLFADKETIEQAKEKSIESGVLEGSDMAKMFAWLRPNDLIWNYWVNNYLLGKEPPAFDILYWNNDTTRLPAKLHADFLDLYANNPLTKEGEFEIIKGHPVDLKKVTWDTFLLGGLSDHITPWKATYANVQLLGGKVDYVLSHSGHIQSLINPPGNPKATYYTHKNLPETADDFLETATKQDGSWWPHWCEWLTTRSGTSKNAPKKLGNKKYKPLCEAPGTYVHE